MYSNLPSKKSPKIEPDEKTTEKVLKMIRVFQLRPKTCKPMNKENLLIHPIGYCY